MSKHIDWDDEMLTKRRVRRQVEEHTYYARQHLSNLIAEIELLNALSKDCGADDLNKIEQLLTSVKMNLH